MNGRQAQRIVAVGLQISRHRDRLLTVRPCETPLIAPDRME